MNIHYFQHVPFEGLGSIEAWALEHGHNLSATRFFNRETPPALETIDWLIVLGGPMNIYEEAQYPWLVQEKRYIQQAIQANKIVLGICLGAQLIADILGAKVTRNAWREIGWFPIKLIAQGQQSPLFDFLPSTLMALHWHGDTFDLPEGAIHIATSEGCQHQAFSYGDNVVALQFHLESMPQSLASLIENCGAEIIEDRYVQTADTMQAAQNNFTAINQAMLGFLDRLAAQNV